MTRMMWSYPKAFLADGCHGHTLNHKPYFLEFKVKTLNNLA